LNINYSIALNSIDKIEYESILASLWHQKYSLVKVFPLCVDPIQPTLAPLPSHPHTIFLFFPSCVCVGGVVLEFLCKCPCHIWGIYLKYTMALSSAVCVWKS